MRLRHQYHYFTKGQIYLVGDRARRKQLRKADYLLRYSEALALARACLHPELS
jgi:hypothetical protein